MLRFLIDANTSSSTAQIFIDLGFQSECVNNNVELRNQSDEAIFNYAVKEKIIIVTKDLGFANPLRFDLAKAPGMIILRFPNEITISKMNNEIGRLLKGISQEDFHNLLLIQPGSIRKRPLSLISSS